MLEPTQLRSHRLLAVLCAVAAVCFVGWLLAIAQGSRNECDGTHQVKWERCK